MSKYQELCERFGKTKNAFNKSKAIFEQTFKQKLSDYLECEADLILLKSSEPQLGEELQHGWEWEYDFNLEITLKTTYLFFSRMLGSLLRATVPHPCTTT